MCPPVLYSRVTENDTIVSGLTEQPFQYALCCSVPAVDTIADANTVVRTPAKLYVPKPGSQLLYGFDPRPVAYGILGHGPVPPVNAYKERLCSNTHDVLKLGPHKPGDFIV